MMGSNIVSGDTKGSMDTLGQLIDIASDPKKAKQLIDEMRQAKEEYQQAMVDLKLGSSAQKAYEEADTTLKEAKAAAAAMKAEAEAAIAEAEERAKEIMASAKAAYDQLQSDRAIVKRQREGNEAMQKELDSELEQAKKLRQQAENFKTAYEAKLKAVKAKISEMESI